MYIVHVITAVYTNNYGTIKFTDIGNVCSIMPGEVMSDIYQIYHTPFFMILLVNWIAHQNSVVE